MSFSQFLRGQCAMILYTGVAFAALLALALWLIDVNVGFDMHLEIESADRWLALIVVPATLGLIALAVSPLSYAIYCLWRRFRSDSDAERTD